MKKKLLSILNNHVVDHPTPRYLQILGFSAAICLVVQILTGIFLAMHYTPHIDSTFLSMENIMHYSSYLAMAVYIICYIYIARSTYHSASKNGYFLGVTFLVNKVIKGTATKANLITNAMMLNKPQLVGIDNIQDLGHRYEFVSHFEEMRKIQSLKKDYIYLPITDQIRSLLKGSNVNGKCYDGHLHDGLVYDFSNGNIVEKIEFKSKLNGYFSAGSMFKLKAKYEPLGVNRIDLCCGNPGSYEKTLLNIDRRNQDLFPVKFKAKDFTEFFDEKINTDTYSADVVDKVIDKQIELKPIIIDAQYRLLKDPDFFGQESISKIDLKLFEDIFSCNLNL
jgi:hypothetical protein